MIVWYPDTSFPFHPDSCRGYPVSLSGRIKGKSLIAPISLESLQVQLMWFPYFHLLPGSPPSFVRNRNNLSSLITLECLREWHFPAVNYYIKKINNYREHIHHTANVLSELKKIGHEGLPLPSLLRPDIRVFRPPVQGKRQFCLSGISGKKIGRMQQDPLRFITYPLQEALYHFQDKVVVV